MSKKRVIMTAAAGLVSFAGMFVFAWLTKPSPESPAEDAAESAGAGDESVSGLPQPGINPMDTIDLASGPAKKALTEQQLRNLVQDVREKMREYDNRLQSLAVREQRLQAAQDVLKEDIENLNNLRIELASTVADVRSQRDKLLKSRLEIDQAEKANLVIIAATYDKMDVTGASKILTNMCKEEGTGEIQDPEAGNGGGYDDAVKILHYMTERTKAKLLAELATSEPTLAADLCQRLKQIVEGS